jgi:hypothetical protein
MPTSSELIRDFTNKNHIDINGNVIRNIIEGLMSKTNSNKMREENISKYIQNTYSQIAEEFERTRADNMLNSPDTASKTTSFEFFQGYVNIISEIAKEASNHVLSQGKAEIEHAKKAVEDAQKVYDDAKKEIENAENNYKARHDGSTNGIEIIEDYKKLKDNVEIAKIKLENAEAKRARGVDFIAPFQQSNPYFNMNADIAKDLLEKQVKSCNYMELRRAQIERLGIRTNSYVLEIENANIPESVTYKDATAEQKRKLQEIHATKQIMQEKLDSRTTGTFAWFKRWWYRKDIAALNSYMNAANQTLSRAKFDQQDAADAIDTMTNKGFFHDEYKASGAEKIFTEQMTRKLPESEIAATSKMPIKDQLLRLGFRPSTLYKDFLQQMEAYKEVKAHITANEKNIPEDVMTVFKKNSKKLREVKKLYDDRTRTNALNDAERICKDIENETLFKISHEDYHPTTFDALVEATSVKQSVKVDLETENKDKNIEVSQPVKDELVKNKDNIVIGN